MALRRIRLQSFAPLPSFRVWFLVPQNVVDVQSLKRSLSTQLPALKDSDIRPTQLVLEIDDFELLDNTSIDLVHEGDTISVKPREPADWLKRKADVEKDGRTLKRRRVSVSSEDSSSVSSSRTSDSSSDSSSSDSGSTSSASDSDSTDSGPSSIRKTSLSNNKKVQAKGSPAIQSHAASHVRTANTHQPTVPPGLGKPSTHSRNRRRKLKRKYAAAALSQKDNSVQLDELPSSTRSNGVLGSSLQPSEQISLSTPVSVTSDPSTKNHTKGKRSSKSMQTPAAQGVIDSSSAATLSGCPPTFIPPSEREDLPKNMFVTSIEVDWRTDQGATSQKHGNVHLEAEVQDDDYAVQALDPNPRHSIDWAVIETTWDRYKTLEPSTKLLPDSIVGWKAFDIDPVTLTPQASMLHLGKVVSLDEENVLIQPLTRPNTGRASFGRATIGEDDELSEQILQPLKEIWCNDWKLIPYTEGEI